MNTVSSDITGKLNLNLNNQDLLCFSDGYCELAGRSRARWQSWLAKLPAGC
jgi:hypothetical protein